MPHDIFKRLITPSSIIASLLVATIMAYAVAAFFTSIGPSLKFNGFQLSNNDTVFARASTFGATVLFKEPLANEGPASGIALELKKHRLKRVANSPKTGNERLALRIQRENPTAHAVIASGFPFPNSYGVFGPDNTPGVIYLPMHRSLGVNTNPYPPSIPQEVTAEITDLQGVCHATEASNVIPLFPAPTLTLNILVYFLPALLITACLRHSIAVVARCNFQKQAPQAQAHDTHRRAA